MKAAISYSDDGDAWDTPTTFGNTVSTAYVWGYASTFQTVDNAKRWFRVGVRGTNDTGQSANVDMGTVSVEIDLQAR